MAAQYSMVLDFFLNLKTDKTKFDRFINEVETALKTLHPEIDFKTDDVKKGLGDLTKMLQLAETDAGDLQKILSALNIDINTEEGQKQLQKLATSLNEIDKIDLNDLDKSLKDLDKVMAGMDDKELGQMFDKLGTEIQQAQQELTEMISKNRAVQTALKNSGGEGTEAYDKLTKEIKEAEENLKKLGATAGKTKINDPLENVGNNAKSIGDKMATFGMAVQGIEQITQTMDQFTQPFIELDKQVRNIGTLGVKNFNDFAAEATKLSKEIPESAGNIAAGVYDAISAGTIKVKNGMADVGEGMNFVKVAAKLATAGLTSTQDSVNGLTSIMNAYGMSADKAGKVSDTMFQTVNAGKLTIPELNASLAQVIPTAAAFGVSFEQVGGAFATMTKQGVPATQAATKLNALLTELAKPGAALKPIMEKAGVSLNSLKAEGLQVTLGKLGVAMEQSGVSATQAFGSVEAASAQLLMSGKNAKMAADDYGFIQQAAGATDAAFKVAADGVGVKSNLMMNKIQASFNGIMSSFGGFGQTAIATVTKVAPLLTSITGLSTIISTGAIKNISQFGLGIVQKLVPALATGTAGQLKFNAAAMINPYTLIIGGVIALVATLSILSKAYQKTAEEKIKEYKEDLNGLKTQQSVLEKHKLMVKSNIDLVASFKNQGKSAMENKDLLNKLGKAYPGVIKETNSFEENLRDLTKAAEGSKKEITDMNSQILAMKSREIHINVLISKQEVEKQVEKIGSAIEEGGSGFDKLFSKVFGAEGTTAQERAKNLTQPYLDAMRKASSSEEISKIANQFQVALSLGYGNALGSDKLNKLQKANVDMLVGMFSSEQKGKIQNIVSSMADAQIKSLAKQKEANKMYILTEYQMWKDNGLAEEEAIKKTVEEQKKKHKTFKDLDAERVKQIVSNYNKEKTLTPPIVPPLGGDTPAQTKAEKSYLEVLKEKYDIKAKELEQSNNEISTLITRNALNNNRKETDADEIINLNKKYDSVGKLITAFKEMLTAEKNAGEITISPEGKIDFSKTDIKKITEKDRLEIQAWLDKDISDELDLSIQIKAKAESIQIDKQSLLDKQSEIDLMKIEYDISMGIDVTASKQKILDGYNETLSVIQSKLNENKAKSDALIVPVKLETESDNDFQLKVNNYDDALNKITASNQELTTKEYDTLAKIRDFNKEILDKQLEDTQKAWDKKIALLERRSAQELAIANRNADAYQKSLAKIQELYKTKGLKAIDDEQTAQIKKLDEYKEMKSISEEEYQSRKTEIESRAQDERTKREDQFNSLRMMNEKLRAGQEIQLEREVLVAKQKSLDEQMKKLAEKGKVNVKTGVLEFDDVKDKAAYDKISETLTAANEAVKEKGSELENTVQTLQGGLSDTISNLFAGDTAGAVESMKGMFSELLGVFSQYLSKMISGFILETVLNISKAQIAANPWIGMLLVPLVYTAVSSGVNALAQPLLNSMSRMPTGGRFDEPTLVGNTIIGDGSRLGGKNREWLFRDDQLISMITSTVKMGADIQNQRMANIEAGFKNLRLETSFKGSDLRIVLSRADYDAKKRTF